MFLDWWSENSAVSDVSQIGMSQNSEDNTLQTITKKLNSCKLHPEYTFTAQATDNFAHQKCPSNLVYIVVLYV